MEWTNFVILELYFILLAWHAPNKYAKSWSPIKRHNGTVILFEYCYNRNCPMEPFKNSEKRIITWKKSKFPPGKKIKNLVSFLNIFWETFHQSGGFKSDKRCQPWARNSVFLERKCSRTTIYREFWRSSTLPEHWVSAKNQGEPALKKIKKTSDGFWLELSYTGSPPLISVKNPREQLVKL